MQTEPAMTRPAVIGISWLAASVALPLAVCCAACGQGFGAMAGGCRWIGLSLPLDRHVWALVNQPALNFASLPGASGYWLGSLLLPLLAATAIVGFLPRAQSLVTELSVVQIAWAMAVVAAAWQPLIDPEDGHVARFLALHGLPAGWVWLAPACAAGAALLPTLRLLELARRRRPDLGRGARLATVMLHLLPPALAWVWAASLARGAVAVVPSLAVALPMASTTVFAWLRYPSPYVRRLEGPRGSEVVTLVVAAAALWAVIWFTGRPTGGGHAAGVLWAQPQAFNNIRPWIDARPLIGGPDDAPSE